MKRRTALVGSLAALTAATSAKAADLPVDLQLVLAVDVSRSIDEVEAELQRRGYIEALTNEIEKRAVDYLEKIEAMGGMLKAIERGYVQQEIQNAAYEYQQAVDREEAVVVGVNRFQVEQDHTVPIQRIDPTLEPKQVERLRALRAKRNADTWKAALQAVEDTARTGENLMPRILAAVEANATVGEISDAMRKVYGEYKEAVVI